MGVILANIGIPGGVTRAPGADESAVKTRGAFYKDG